VLADPSVYGTTLVAWLVECYGSEALQWRPLTVRLELQRDWAVTLSDAAAAKLTAARRLLLDEAFYDDPTVFAATCHFLAGNAPMAGYRPGEPEEYAWGVAEALVLAPPDDLQHAFAPAIARYVGMVLAEHGFAAPPPVLSFALLPTSAPSLTGAAAARQEELRQGLERHVRDGLQTLLSQLRRLPFQEGNTQELESRVFAHTQDAAEAGPARTA